MKTSTKISITKSSSKPLYFLITLLAVITIVILTVGVFFLIKFSLENKNKGAIVTNGLECAEMGRRIFEKGGNVADAAVTVVLCEGVAMPQR